MALTPAHGHDTPQAVSSAASSPSPLARMRASHAARVTLGVLGLVAISLHVWFLSDTALPMLRAMWAPADFLQSAFAALGYGTIALLALKAPEAVRPLSFTVGTAALIVVGKITWLAGMEIANVPLAVVGICVAHFFCSWPVVMVGISLAALGNRNDLITATVLGEAIGVALRCVLPHPGFEVAIPLTIAPPLLALAFSSVLGIPYLRREISGEMAVERATTEPAAYLSPSHRVFVLVGLFELIHGVALVEKSADLTLATNVGQTLIVIVGAAILLKRRDVSHEDVLLYVGSLMMLFGFLLSPLSDGETVVSGAVSLAGASFSWMLLWLALASVGMIYPLGALWVFGVGYVFQALGLAVGSEIGHLAIMSANDTLVAQMTNVINAVVMVGFVAYLLIGLRGFSFSRTFAEIVPAKAPVRSDDSQALIERGCKLLAAACDLTEREGEVFLLLAEGRSGSEIQEELSISRNTAKTHVRHIYRKLGVHSQQELIDAVVQRAK